MLKGWGAGSIVVDTIGLCQMIIFLSIDNTYIRGIVGIARLERGTWAVVVWAIDSQLGWLFGGGCAGNGRGQRGRVDVAAGAIGTDWARAEAEMFPVDVIFAAGIFAQDLSGSA